MVCRLLTIIGTWSLLLLAVLASQEDVLRLESRHSWPRYNALTNTRSDKDVLSGAHAFGTNATGFYPTKGFDTFGHNGSNAVEGWQWLISVRDSFLTSYGQVNVEERGYVSETAISLIPPEDLLMGHANETRPDAWRICAFFITELVAATNDRLQDDDGSCSSGISDQCRREIELVVANAQSTPGACRCPDFSNTCLRHLVTSESPSCKPLQITMDHREESAQKALRLPENHEFPMIQRRGPRGDLGPPAWCEIESEVPDPCNSLLSYTIPTTDTTSATSMLPSTTSTIPTKSATTSASKTDIQSITLIFTGTPVPMHRRKKP